MNAAQLIDALRARGFTAADVPAASGDDERPWYLSLLVGLAGWLAGVFVLVFIGIFLDLKSTHDLLGIGLALLVVAWLMYFFGGNRVFVDQLALALSIAGQIAITFYLFDTLKTACLIAIAILCMQLVLFVAMPDRVARTLAAFFACVAWVFVVRFWLRPVTGVDVFFDPAGHTIAPRYGIWTLPLEWMITWAPLMTAMTWLRRTEPRWMARPGASYARPAITGLLLGLALAGVGAEPASLFEPGANTLGLPFDWWALFPLLSIALAMFAAWNAYLLRSDALTGLAIVAALLHLARFYYLYGTTLTIKSAIMLIVGGAFLAAAVVIERHGAKAAT